MGDALALKGLARASLQRLAGLVQGHSFPTMQGHNGRAVLLFAIAGLAAARFARRLALARCIVKLTSNHLARTEGRLCHILCCHLFLMP